MADVAAGGQAPLTIPQRTDVRQRRGGRPIVAEIRSRCRTEQQADAAERLIRTLSRDHRRKGDQLTYTWRQLAGALGKPVEGLSQRRARELYRGSIRRTLLYLIDWGYVAGFEALYEPNGEGRCIVITLPAGVAQSVRAAANSRTGVRVKRQRRRSSFCGEVCTPRGGLQGVGDSSSPSTRTEEADARARDLGTRDRALVSTECRAALQRIGERGSEWGGVPTGVAFLEAAPELVDVPIELVAQEAWRLFAGHDELGGGGDCRLAVEQGRRLQNAARQLERTGYGVLPAGPAAPRAAVIDLAAGDWRDHWSSQKGVKPPATLGGLAHCLRHLAHREGAGRRVRRRARQGAAAARG